MAKRLNTSAIETMFVFTGNSINSTSTEVAGWSSLAILESSHEKVNSQHFTATSTTARVCAQRAPHRDTGADSLGEWK